jgi:hypothetical protein
MNAKETEMREGAFVDVSAMLLSKALATAFHCKSSRVEHRSLALLEAHQKDARHDPVAKASTI